MQKSGPSPVLWVILGVLVVALIGGGIFLLTSGDDDDGDETSTGNRRSTTTSQEGGEDGDITVPTLPDDGGSDTTEGDDSGSGSGDVVSALADNIYSNTGTTVDRDESACIAGVITEVAGEDVVSEAGADYQSIYGQTSTSQDDAIATGIYSCTDVESDEDLISDPNWPDAWEPRSS